MTGYRHIKQRKKRRKLKGVYLKRGVEPPDAKCEHEKFKKALWFFCFAFTEDDGDGGLISVVIGLIGTGHREVEVLCLGGGHRRKLDVQAGQVSSSDFLV